MDKVHGAANMVLTRGAKTPNAACQSLQQPQNFIMKKVSGNSAERVELGRYIVADSLICHGKPTFKGTRIMVWQVLDDVADGRSWDFICNARWGGRIPLAAVAEAVKLAETAWLGPARRAGRRQAELVLA